MFSVEQAFWSGAAGRGVSRRVVHPPKAWAARKEQRTKTQFFEEPVGQVEARLKRKAIVQTQDPRKQRNGKSKTVAVTTNR
jgi:hypothetical protein